MTLGQNTLLASPKLNGRQDNMWYTGKNNRLVKSEMVRQARIKSATGIHHVMLKGLDGRHIFLDDSDRSIFMEKLNKARKTGGFQLYAYCLMDNHVHLLIKEGEELGTSIKRITVGYVQLHNNKYGRTGHLVQNRFNSEAVEDEQYLITVMRYIHRNPATLDIEIIMGEQAFKR